MILRFGVAHIPQLRGLELRVQHAELRNRAFWDWGSRSIAVESMQQKVQALCRFVCVLTYSGSGTLWRECAHALFLLNSDDSTNRLIAGNVVETGAGCIQSSDDHYALVYLETICSVSRHLYPCG